MRTLRDDFLLQRLDFIITSHPIDFASEASKGNRETRDNAIRSLTQSNELLFRPASDYRLRIFDTTWLPGF